MIVVAAAAAVAWCGGREHSDKVTALSMASAKYEPVVAIVAAAVASEAAAAEASEDAVLVQTGVPGGEASVGDFDTADSPLLHLFEGRLPRSVVGVVIALTAGRPGRPGCVAKGRLKGSIPVLLLVYPLRRHCYRRYYSNCARRFHGRHGVLHVHVVPRREKPLQSQSPSTIQDHRLPKKMKIGDHLRHCYRRRRCLER